ncbi:MAG: hypothetical protein M3305_08385 [Actinomycetota bacterium]|jgi:hypothetical protein|nr:hypothetical protein [Actinomycetota bacterium]
MEDEYTEISNDSAVALVRKVRTRNGVRLEVYSPETDRQVYLDPLHIESLAWQTPETFSNTLEDPPEVADLAGVEERRVTAKDEYTELSNEFAFTLVRKVRVGDDARLEILSPKLDYQIYLDAPLLESLTWQTPQTLSKFLEEPYGPRGTH